MPNNHISFTSKVYWNRTAHMLFSTYTIKQDFHQLKRLETPAFLDFLVNLLVLYESNIF